MSASFDPYREWLEIPPAEQPPHHYRLLGIPLFEANSTVISLAADRQIGFLESVHDAEHGFLAEQLTKSIEAARTCLLDASRKSTYDAKLRAKLASSSAHGDSPSSVTPNTVEGALDALGQAPAAPLLTESPLDAANAQMQSATSEAVAAASLDSTEATVLEAGEEHVDIAPRVAPSESNWVPVPAWMEESAGNASPPANGSGPSTSASSMSASAPPAITPPRSAPRAAPLPSPSARDAARPSVPTASPVLSDDSEAADGEEGADDSLGFLSKPGVKRSPALEPASSPRSRGPFPTSPAAKGRPVSGPARATPGSRGKLPATYANANDAPTAASSHRARLAAIFIPTVIVSIILIIWLGFFAGDSKSSSKKSNSSKPAAAASGTGKAPKK